MINNEVLVSLSKVMTVIICLGVIAIVIWQNMTHKTFPKFFTPLLLVLFALTTWSILNPKLPISVILLFCLGVLLYLMIQYVRLFTQVQSPHKPIIYQDNSQLIALTQEQERSRIYANLHDDVGAKLLELIYTAKDDESKKLAKEVLADIRQAVAKTENFQCTVQQLADSIITESKVRLRTASLPLLEDVKVLSEKQKLTILSPSMMLRITREVISNIIKHAQATQVHISIISNNDLLTIMIKDDGLGFVASEQVGKGLKTIKKRAKSIAAEVKWQSTPNNGTTFILQYRHGNK